MVVVHINYVSPYGAVEAGDVVDVDELVEDTHTDSVDDTQLRHRQYPQQHLL